MPTVAEKTSLEREIENLNNTKNISAACALRRDILSQPGVILLCQAGSPDRIIKVVPMASRKLDLGNGPQAEEWREIERQIYTMSRRDRPIPTPVAVSASSKEEWSIRAEDVPTVYLLDASASVSTSPVAPQAVAPVVASVQGLPVEPTTKLDVVAVLKEEAPVKEDRPALNRGLAADKTPLTCADCGKTFKGHNGLKIHRTTRHKPGYGKP